jgi:thioredoxin-like negative regulator of GroEL
MKLLGQVASAFVLVPVLCGGCASSASVNVVSQTKTTSAVATTKPAEETPAPPAETPAAPEETDALQTPLSLVIAEATSKRMPVLLYFGTTWCEPCKVLDEKVLPNPEVADALLRWRFQKYDAEKDYGGDAALRFRVNSFPTLIVLNPAGNEVDRMNASTDPKAFLAQLNRFLEPGRQGPLTDAEVHTNREPRRLLAAAHVAERADRPVAARMFYKAAIKADVGGRDGSGPEASVALMKLNARSVVRKDHAARLKKYLERYRDSAAAGSALEGLAALVPESLPVPMKLVRQAGAALVQARANDAWALERLGAALERLGDLEGAEAARAAATTAPRKELTAPAIISATRLHDPLEPSPMEILSSMSSVTTK